LGEHVRDAVPHRAGADHRHTGSCRKRNARRHKRRAQGLTVDRRTTPAMNQFRQVADQERPRAETRGVVQVVSDDQQLRQPAR